ncbi:peptidylprolyl isomerase [Bradyrhizobium sp. ORS 86]|uniref:peptidylprolyl isomerase n=1 Tax=Bradyrhizobium sp. ORS 86 TaxID=1685970 RepID=UPI0038910902
MTVSVNGVAVRVDEATSAEFAAARELLRQRAVSIGLLATDEADANAVGEGIERLLSVEVKVPAPTEAECRRYYETHGEEFISGDLVHARHILFQVTLGVPVPKIRARAEQALNAILAEPNRFAALAEELSNCPSGRQGGDLGQIARGTTVPEFEKALFRIDAVGILPELVKTRYGFHIVAVDRMIPGQKSPFEMVHADIAQSLRSSVERRALKQYVAILAGEASVVGVDLDAASSPLVQ